MSVGYAYSDEEWCPIANSYTESVVIIMATSQTSTSRGVDFIEKLVELVLQTLLNYDLKV